MYSTTFSFVLVSLHPDHILYHTCKERICKLSNHLLYWHMCGHVINGTQGQEMLQGQGGVWVQDQATLNFSLRYIYNVMYMFKYM